MPQLVREQLLALRGARREATGAEDDVVADREGVRVDGVRGLLRGGVGVHAHAAEVVTEARLHRRPRRLVERLTGRAKHFVDDRRRVVETDVLRLRCRSPTSDPSSRSY